MKLAVFALLLVVLPFQASSYVCDTLIVEMRQAQAVYGDSWDNPTDAYVKAIVDGHIKYTHVIESDFPVWNKDLKFTNVKSNTVKFEIWDDDDFLRGGDDLLKTCVEKLKLGSYALRCGKGKRGLLWYGIHCLKGNMKRRKLYNGNEIVWVD